LNFESFCRLNYEWKKAQSPIENQRWMPLVPYAPHQSKLIHQRGESAVITKQRSTISQLHGNQKGQDNMEMTLDTHRMQV
jgi:hypothetical protein